MPQLIRPLLVLTALLGFATVGLAQPKPQQSDAEVFFGLKAQPKPQRPETEMFFFGPTIAGVNDPAVERAVTLTEAAFLGLKAAGLPVPQPPSAERTDREIEMELEQLFEQRLSDPIDRAIYYGIKLLRQQKVRDPATSNTVFTLQALMAAGALAPQKVGHSPGSALAQPVVDTIRVEGGRVEIVGERIVIEGGRVVITRRQAAVAQPMGKADWMQDYAEVVRTFYLGR